MTVGSEYAARKAHTTDGADGTSRQAEWDDEYGAVVRAAGRQIKLWREAAGLTQAELGEAIGYSLGMVSAVERAKRLPHPEFLTKADAVLGAGGKLAAMKDDVAEARYPKKVRDLARLEAEAVEMGAYASTVIPGLLQTEEYARAVLSQRCPAYNKDEHERLLAARLARQEIFGRQPTPLLTFVLDEAVLRRPIGGRMVLRRQLGHLAEIGKLPYVGIQVLPLGTEEHAGLDGSLRVLKLKDGKVIGQHESHLASRLVSDPKEAQIFDMRYGTIRAQALTPRESLAFIEKLLGETP